MNIMELPDQFKEKMKELLGDAYGDYLASFDAEDFHGLRVNTLKCSPEEFLHIMPWNLKQVPWISNGFFYDGADKPARHPYYYAGLFYLQEPSAMTPANLLPVEPGDYVLDLCAAPGGKSTELAAKLRGKGLLFANDISNSRAKALLKNLELAGVGNALIASEPPEKLSGLFEGFFDKILVDAPCSGEGMFRRDSKMAESWLEKGPEYYSKIQKSIVEEAVKMLKPGGKLLYSTCTFDRDEDEGTVRSILENHADMHPVMLEKKEGFEPGAGMPECVRLFPHRIDGEGHFIALLEKEASQNPPKASRKAGTFLNLSKEELAAVRDFLSLTGRSFDERRIYSKNENVYYLPEPFLYADAGLLTKIRYLRTGLLLGELKKGRFEPSQALALYLNGEAFADTLMLRSEDGRVIRYLKGETILLDEEEQASGKGWCLVCVDGFPLGWAKRQGGTLKNKYYPGWRWQ